MSLMSSLEYVKKECFASGNLSSASLKGTFTKIQNRRHRTAKIAPNAHEKTDNECDFCRHSISPCVGGNRTVRRILIACLLSFMALLGAVSTDLRSNLALLRATETAFEELTSCRALAIVQLVGKVQQLRSLCSNGNETHRENCSSPSILLLPLFKEQCLDMNNYRSSQGFSCSMELASFCKKISNNFTEFLNATWTESQTNQTGTCIFSLSVDRLFSLWGTVEEDIRKIKQYSDWKYVLSARLLAIFIELNLQLMDIPYLANQPDFQDRWTRTLGHLAFARLMSDRMNSCWLENQDRKANSTDALKHRGDVILTGWQISEPNASRSLSGSQSGIESLRDTHRCLLSAAVPRLRSAVRALFSDLSMRICLLALACLIYPVVLVSFKQMTEWIQNYARSLREKTEDLRRQRQLAEDLLHQMLPKSVAKQLRQQKHVEAESYENVTIFFSDIVGFTSISASCNPLQVVEMLNNLYMCFDTRIDSYDVYKVETIGDAYMVVSGLPERNGDKHADEIAKMALDLVAAVRQVVIPHMPNKRLQLRAGIHTGPCVAGIVGYKMPRYCLFGDTVNTASRMESTSLPQKIHTSSATYLALMKDNAYELQLRGEVEVKGKGKMSTYWLVGHKNYSVQNDSLVCHWRPGLAKKKKTLIGSEDSMGNSCVTVQSYRTENTTTPVSLQEVSPGGASAPLPPRSEGPVLSVSAQVEHASVGYSTLGSRVGGLRGEEGSPHPTEKIPTGGMEGKLDLLPGSLPHF